MRWLVTDDLYSTLPGTNMSHPKAHLKMIFLLLRWDMIVSRRVMYLLPYLSLFQGFACWRNMMLVVIQSGKLSDHHGKGVLAKLFTSA